MLHSVSIVIHITNPETDGYGRDRSPRSEQLKKNENAHFFATSKALVLSFIFSLFCMVDFYSPAF